MSTLYCKDFTADSWLQLSDDLYTISIPSSESGLTGDYIAWTLVQSAGEYINTNGVYGDISFKYTILNDIFVLNSNAPFDGRIILAEGTTKVEPGRSYSVDYTGDEVNKALGRLLGDAYGDDVDPGCHLIGKDSYNPVNLNTVRVPGAYTAYFYNHGPSVLNVYNGTSPIRMHVYSDEDFAGSGQTAMWQTIEALVYTEADLTTGQEAGEQLFLFYRDILHCSSDDESVDYGWSKMKLSTGSTVVVNNLKSDNQHIALSANMGRYLKHLIDTDDQGTSNLLLNSDFNNGDTGWILSSDASIIEDDNQAENMFGRPSHGILIYTENTDYCGVATDAAYMPIINGTEKNLTASVYVRSATNATVFAQIQLCDENGEAIIQAIETTDNDYETDSESAEPYAVTLSSYMTVTSLANSNLSRITITIPRVDLFATIFSAKKVSFYFGVVGGGEARFFHPQLELGKHPTAWHPNWYDMWFEYDNARYLNEIHLDSDVNIDTIKDQQTFVFSAEEQEFIARYIATGGGGGFVAQDDPPEETEMLWYCTKTNRSANYYAKNFYAYIDGSWKQLAYKVLVSPTQPDDRSTLWVNTSTSKSYSGCRPYSETEPPDLLYYDTTYGKWRVIGAARRPGFIIQREVPAAEDSDLMWIHPDTWIARVYYNNKWYPIQAVWGADNV